MSESRLRWGAFRTEVRGEGRLGGELLLPVGCLLLLTGLPCNSPQGWASFPTSFLRWLCWFSELVYMQRARSSTNSLVELGPTPRTKSTFTGSDWGGVGDKAPVSHSTPLKRVLILPPEYTLHGRVWFSFTLRHLN